jgi:uncharacterized protein YcaQ
LDQLELSSSRLEFIAPLDNLIWDRSLLFDLFDFDYRWEIYTPQPQRKYGYYVLPVLYKDRFVARIELVRNGYTLECKNLWLEPGFKPGKAFCKALNLALARFQRFNDCEVLAVSESVSAIIGA